MGMTHNDAAMSLAYFNHSLRNWSLIKQGSLEPAVPA
jgi:hypothetical protein